MRDCRSTKNLHRDGAHLVAQLRDMLEIDGYELWDVKIYDPRTGAQFGWHDLRVRGAEGSVGK